MERMEISEVRQKPTRIYLENGTVIEINVQVQEVHKTGEVNERGEPVYQVRHNVGMVVVYPKEGEAAEPLAPGKKVSLH